MPSATAALATGAVATAGNPAAGQRGKFQQLPRFRVRVIDPVTGSVLIDRLPHIALEYETIFPQLGMAGASTIGHFVIHLYHPMTDEYAWAKVWYDKLGPVQRVEIYMTEDPDGYGAVGDPEFTGVIENLPKEDFSFRIEGEDSLKLLDWSRTLQSDTFTGSTSDLLKYALKTYGMTQGDDFTGDLSAYSNNGSWTLTTDQGFSSVKTGLANDGLLYTTASYTNSKYADCFVEAPYRITCGSQSTNVAEAGVIAAVADVNNFVMGRAFMRQVTATQYYLDAEILQKSGGVYTRQVLTQSVISEPGPTAQVTVTLQGVQTSATQYTWTLLLNEIDSKCTWVQTVASGSPTGGVGLRSSGASSTAYVQHHLVFLSKSNAFQVGNVAPGVQRFNANPIPSQTCIDLVQLAATTEGNTWKKHCKPGLNNDQIDFGVTVGNDLSGIVRLEENIHIVSSQTEPNAEPINTAVLAAGHPNYNNRGHHRWYDIPSSKSRGVVITPLVLPQTVDHFGLRQMAQNVLLKRKQPTQAGRATVLRHEDHAQLPGQPTPTGLAYRDGDWVTQHEPHKGISYKRVQVMSVKVVSGIPTMELTLDQYPVYTDRLPLVDRLNSIVTSAQLGRADSTVRDPIGVLRDSRQVLPNNPWKMQAYVAAAQSITSSGVGTVMHLDTPVFDTANGFDAVNHWYTVPVTGYYAVSVTTTINLTGGVTWFLITPVVYNRTTGLTLDQSVAVNGTYPGGSICLNTNYGQTLSDIQYFNVGDQIQAVCIQQNSAATAQPLAVGRGLCYMTIHLVSG